MISFANELLLQVFPLLPLRSLIVAQGVDRRWRQLVAAADVYPLRRELLDLYLTIINSPWFLQTRPWVLDNLQPFDREAYVDALLAQYHRLPEAFMLWLLEWPARAIVGGIWPGLPWEHKQDTDGIQIFRGANWLSPRTVQVSAITYWIPGCKGQYDFISAILVRSHTTYTWLILDDDEDEREKGTLKLRDKVFALYARETHLCDEMGSSGPDYDVVNADWIAFQRDTWQEVEKRAKSGPRFCHPAGSWRELKGDRVDAPLWSMRYITQQPKPHIGGPGALRVRQILPSSPHV